MWNRQARGIGWERVKPRGWASWASVGSQGRMNMVPATAWAQQGVRQTNGTEYTFVCCGKRSWATGLLENKLGPALHSQRTDRGRQELREAGMGGARGKGLAARGSGDLRIKPGGMAGGRGQPAAGVHREPGGCGSRGCLLFTGDDGQAGSALGCPVLPAPCHLCSFNRYFLRHIRTQPWRSEEGLGLRAPRGGRKQESKPAGGRDIIEDFPEVCTPELGLEG